MDNYLIGVGRRKIVIKHVVNLQGMADPNQRSSGTLHELYSRAFIIENSSAKVAIVIVDIWSCTRSIKKGVLAYLNRKLFGNYFQEDNLMIAGTHTHSGPGGYAGYKLYDSPGGKDKKTFEAIVKAIGESIISATKNVRRGNVYYGVGIVKNCGSQRSPKAYLNNPNTEREAYESNTDEEMQLLKFTHVTNDGESPVGLINWYAIHPTDLGQSNTKLSGDNKGLASILFERYAKNNFSNAKFVAAFGNANCGDVSPRVDRKGKEVDDDKSSLDQNAKRQYEAAKKIFERIDLKKLSANIDCVHKRVDLSRVKIKNTHSRTWPFALGFSFVAGSSEDSKPIFGFPGFSFEVKNVREGLDIEGILKTPYAESYGLISTGLAMFFRTTLPDLLPNVEVMGHHPKPITFAPRSKTSLVPHNLPFQIMSIGEVAIIGVPAELTTMAGRRLREEIKKELQDSRVREVVLSTYTNEYAQYISTREEYNTQHYEGASTPFGPYTLKAFIQHYLELLRPEDIYIDFRCNKPKRVKYEVKYKNEYDKLILLTTLKDINEYRFSLPYNATEISARIKYESKSGKIGYSKWSKLQLIKPGQAILVEVKGRVIKKEEIIRDKTIYLDIDYGTYLKAHWSYSNSSGKMIRKHSKNSMNYVEIKVPYNATNIKLHASYAYTPQSRNPSITNELSVELKVHERVDVSCRNGVLINYGVDSNW